MLQLFGKYKNTYFLFFAFGEYFSAALNTNLRIMLDITVDNVIKYLMNII